MDARLAELGRLFDEPAVRLDFVSGRHDGSNLAEWYLSLTSCRDSSLEVRIQLDIRTWPAVRMKSEAEHALLRVAGLMLAARGVDVELPQGHSHTLGAVLEPTPEQQLDAVKATDLNGPQ